jgi:hypothetical protein
MDGLKFKADREATAGTIEKVQHSGPMGALQPVLNSRSPSGPSQEMNLDLPAPNLTFPSYFRESLLN